MKTNRFMDILDRFSDVKIAVLGDFFLDLYIEMERSRSEFSLETHKEAFQAIGLRGQPGAAGVVANNLASLNAETAAIGYVGNDGNGFALKQALEAQNINTDLLIEHHDRLTLTYIKPLMRELDGHVNELNRIDIINRSPNNHTLNASLLKNVGSAMDNFDGILIVEQISADGHGTMSPLLRGGLTKYQNDYPDKIIMVDSRHHAGDYRGVSIKMNLSEAIQAVGQLENSTSHLEDNNLLMAKRCADQIWAKNQQSVFITLGSEGIVGRSEDGIFHHPGYRIDGPIDIVGAGDSVLAGIGLALCTGATPNEAAYIGNLVGSITVQQIGTTGVVTQKALVKRHKQYQQQVKEQD